MRLDFTILWIDDQLHHIRGFQDSLRRELDQLGFKLEVLAVSSLDKVDEAVGQHVHDDAIDLVLVDYDLTGKGSGGEQALLQVRKKLPFKEIVFYSGTDVQKLREIAFKANVDGIQFSPRMNLVSNATKAIHKLLSKVMDIDHMRGVVMSAASDIDYMVEKSLMALHGALGEAERPAFRDQLVTEVRAKLAKWSSELDEAVAKGDIESLVMLRHLYSAHDKLRSLLKQLASWDAEHQPRLAKIKGYMGDVVPRRNKLAHGMLKREGSRLVIVGMKDPLTAEDMTKLRQELIDHRDNFAMIAVLLDVNLG